MKGFMIDLDGTVWKGDKLIDGAKEAVEHLKTKGRILFCTNSSSKHPSHVLEKINRLGIKAATDELLTTYKGTLEYLKQHSKKTYFIIPKEMQMHFAKDGIEIDKENAKIVVIGFHDASTYKDYDTAFRLILRGAKLVVMNNFLSYPSDDGMHLAPGAFVKGLEEASGKKAFVIGKPSHHYFSTALHMLGTAKKDTYMIGDNLPADINGAKDFGLKTIFVETGTHKREDIKKYSSKPDHVLKSIKDIASLSLTN